MLEVRDLVVRYEGRAAVDGLDLDLAPGQVLALLGPWWDAGPCVTAEPA